MMKMTEQFRKAMEEGYASEAGALVMGCAMLDGEGVPAMARGA